MWQVFSLSSEEYDAARKDYVNAFLKREVLKLSLGLAGITLGGLLLSGVIALPIPTMAALIVGGCLASAGALYSGHKLYQHGLG